MISNQYETGKRIGNIEHTFLCKNTFYKNIEAQITQNLKNNLRTMTRLDARTQENDKGEK